MKGLNAFLDVNELNLGVFTESWITNNSDVNCILKQCFPLGFRFYSAPRVKKRAGGICLLYRYDLHLEDFEKITSDIYECWYVSLTVEATSYLVIAVYRPPGLSVKSFTNHFTSVFCREKAIYNSSRFFF